MTKSVRPCPYRVAVGTPHHAFGHLFFGLGDALGVAYVQGLTRDYVVKVQRGWVSIESAITAPGRHLALVQPAANRSRSFVGGSIDALPISRSGKSRYSPPPRLFRVVDSITMFTVGLLDLIRVALFPSTACFALANSFGISVHIWSIPYANPCKPDIFEATYDEVQP